MLSRRALLLAGAGVGVAGVAGGVGVVEGVLPGRPFVWERLGLNGEDGAVPDVEPGPVEQGVLVSAARLGVEVPWWVTTPPGVDPAGLPVVVALHGAGGDAALLRGPEYDLPRFLAAAVADGVAPFALAAADGGRTYWREQPDGEDAGAMVVEELLPLLAGRGLACGPRDRVGLLGWSMGGYGALHLAGRLGPERVAAVCAVSAAVDAAGAAGASVMGEQDRLAGVAVRVDCGTGDPFYFATQEYLEGFPDDVEVVSSFEPGGHDAGYRRRVLPGELAFLGEHLRPSGRA